MKYDNLPYYIKLTDFYHAVKGATFLCSNCGFVYWHAAEAWSCCEKQKPIGKIALQALLVSLHYQAAHFTLDAPPHAPSGLTEPGKWGHWYRGRNHDLKITATYHRALDNLKRQFTHDECMALNRLFPEWTVEEVTARIRTPSQRFAFAFHTGNYPAALNAVDDMRNASAPAVVHELTDAERTLIRKIQTLIPHDEINGLRQLCPDFVVLESRAAAPHIKYEISLDLADLDYTPKMKVKRG